MLTVFPSERRCAEAIFEKLDNVRFAVIRLHGDRYLVAPVMYEGMRERKVYLPEGKWRSIHGGNVITGGCSIKTDAPLDIIPVFEKL